jgi:hypothetical protein
MPDRASTLNHHETLTHPVLDTHSLPQPLSVYRMELSSDEARANEVGLLTPNQRQWLARRRRQALALCPLWALVGLLGGGIEQLPLLARLALITAGMVLAVRAALHAQESGEALRALFPCVDRAAGQPVVDGVGPGRSISVEGHCFRVAASLARQLDPESTYAFYFVTCTRTLLGWHRLF